MVNSNPGYLTTLSVTPNTRIVDGSDNIHSGIINALNVATGGNSVLSGFNITQEDGGTYTKYDVAAGKVLRNGLLVSISARNDIAPGVGERADNDWYATVVVDSSNVIQIRTGASSVSTASVSSLTAGDIPIAIIKYPAGSDHDAIDRLVQFLGYDQTTKGFSAINSGSETLRINANGTLTKGSATLTLPSSTGTVALTSDITYTSAISQGNAGLVPTGGVATANIADDAVTYAKMQNVSATDKILGRDSSGAGIVEELSPSSVRTMLGIETGATADQSNAEIETAYNAQVSQVSSSERTAGDSTAIKRYAPVDIKSMIDTHQTDTNTDVTVANLKTRLNSDLDGDFTIGSQSNDTAIFSGHMTVGGNLTVNGATQTINSTVVTVDDPVFTLGGDATGLNDNKDRGIEFKWHNGISGKLGFFGFDDSTGKFTFIPDATNSSEVFSGTAGTVVANLEGAVTGNASTATALANSRNFSITGDVTASAVGFTGTGNVALSTTLANDAVATTKIADSAVTSAKIADGTIATGDVADDAITYGKMQDTSTNNRLLGATTAGTIGEVQVATAMVADDAITSAKIADDAVGAEQLASNAVVNASVASNAAIAQSKIDGLTGALSGKEPSLTISDGLDRTGTTLKVDIDGLTVENGINRTADYLMYDDATNGLRRINAANLFALLIASDIPDISSTYRATGTTLVNADISSSAAISADKIANGSTNKVFTATLKSKLDAIEASATAGANWASNVSNISVANSQLAGSIANSKLANSGVTINSNSLNLGGTLTLDTDDFAEGTNKFYTDERVDDRVNALITDGEAITTTYNDGSGSLTIEAELATTSNKGVASFSPTNFDVSSGAVTIKAGGVSNSQVASNAAIAQSKISGLVSDLAGKAGSLSDLSITASAAEINILDGVTGVSATEIGYLDGVTSAIQTQLNTKLSTVAVADLSDISALVTAINSNSTDAQLPTAKAVKEYITQQEVEDKDYQISVALSSGIPLITIADQFGGSSTLAVTGGDRITTGINAGRLTISDSGKGAIASAAFNQGLLTLTHDDGTTTTTTLPDSTTDAHGLMTDDQFDKLAGIEALADVTDKANVVASLGLLNESDTLYLGDAGNDTTVRVRGNFFVDGTLTTINQTEINVQDALVFEGATADDYETTLRIIDPTADRVISLPDITGTVVTTGDTATVATAMIADNAIITAKIPTHAVIAAKLASNSVLTTKINDLAVTTAKLANDAVTGAKISFIDDSIAATDTHIMVADGTDYNNVIVSGDATLANTGALTIANNAITTAKINADAIDGTKIADNAINSEHYTDSSIDEAHIANNAVTVGKISGLTDLGSGTVISSAERTKLSGIETSADVTDATNVTAAGAIMDGDFSSNGFMKRTGAGAYAIDANTYLTSLSVTGLSDIAQLEQNLASITDDHAGLATAKAVKAYVDSIPGGVGGMSFVLEDGDGTEVTVADSKEIKFIPASSLLTINWTDVDNGTDADPYDLTFTVDNDLANYSNTNSSFSTTSALTSATAATAITGKVLTNLGTGTGGAIAAGDTILAAMQKLETRTALNDAKVTNTDINVNVANLTARLPQITENVTIGDGTDVTVTTSGALIVTGNLTVNGTTTTIDTNTVNIGDNIIVLNSDETGTPSQDAGIEVERGSASNKTLTWDETNDKWTIGSENFTAGTFTGALTGDVTGNVSGNAGTATILQNARTIAGKSFNGSANITIATTDLSDISALDTDLSSVSASHDSLATAKAIKTYVDAQVDTEDTLAELDDTNIGSLSAGHLLIYDATAGVWDNAALTGGTNVSVTNADGAITIVSTDTTYSAGQGIALSGTTFSVANPDALTVITDDGAGSTLTAAGADEMMVWDAGSSAWRVMTLANLSDFAVSNGAGGISAYKTFSVPDTGNSGPNSQADVVADDTADTLVLKGDSIAITTGTDLINFNVNIDGLSALGGTGLHQTQDHFMFSDNGTEKKITFSNLEDAIFANVSGDATIAAGGALTIAANSVALGTDTTGNYMTDVSAGTGIDVTHTAAEGSTATIAVDVSDFMTNGADNYVLTATGADGINAEAKLLFDNGVLTLKNTGVINTSLLFRTEDGNGGSSDYSSYGIVSGWESGETNWTQSYLKFNHVDANDSYVNTMTMKGPNVGIGTTSPNAKLHINNDETDASIDAPASFGIHVDHDSSGSQTTGNDDEQGGIYVSAQTTSTGGDSSDEHRLYGMWSDTRTAASSNDSDFDEMIGVYGLVKQQQQPSSGITHSKVSAVDGWAMSSTSSTNDTITNLYGSKGLASVYQSGTVSNLYGGKFQATVQNNRAVDTGAIFGMNAEVQIDANNQSGSDISTGTVKVVSSVFDDNQASSPDVTVTTTNSYLYYGNYSISNTGGITNKWGLYLSNATKNYLSGTLQVTDDVTIDGGKITLTNGSTIDSESAGTLLLTEDIVKTSGDLLVGGNDIKSSTGATAITLSADDVTFADNVTIGASNKLFIADSELWDDGANFKVVGNSQTQYQTLGQWGAHTFYTQNASSSAPNNSTEVFKITTHGNLTLGNNADRTVSNLATAHDVAGKALTISAGDTTAGTTDNIAGGHLTLEGGQGKGTGAGGNIYFKVADGGSSGSTLNSVATALTIFDNTNATFANDVTIGGNLTISGSTTTIDTNIVNIGDSIITLNSDETGTPSADAGIEIERGTSTNKSFYWDESEDKWSVGSEIMVAGTFEGALTGNVTGTILTAAQTNITSLGTLGNLQIDNINLNSNNISSTLTNCDLNITPDGTGSLVLDGQNWPQADGSAGQILKTDGSGQLSWVAPSTVGGDGLAYSGTTANGVLTYGDASTIATESTLTYDPAGQLMIDVSGYARVELHGESGAYIDMSDHDGTNDDYDARLITTGAGLDIITAGASSPIKLKTNGTDRLKIEDAAVTIYPSILQFSTSSAPTIKGGNHNPLTIYGNADGTAQSTTNNIVSRSTAAAIDFDVNASQQLAMSVRDNKDVYHYGVLSGPGVAEGGYGANSFHLGDTGSTEDDDWYEVFRWTTNNTMSATDSNEYKNFSAKFSVVGRGLQRINFDMYVRGEHGVQGGSGWWTKEFIIDGLEQSTDADGNASPDGDSIFKMVYNTGTSLSMPYASLYMRRDEDWEIRTCNLISMFTNCVFEFKDTNVGETTPTNDGATGSHDLSPTIRKKLRVDVNKQLINGVAATGIYFDDANDRLGVGMATPQHNLDIWGSDASIRLVDTSDSDNSAKIVVGEDSSVTVASEASVEYGWEMHYNSAGDDFFELKMMDATNGDVANALVVNRLGNVGIGNDASNGYKLEVSGTTKLSGNVTLGSSYVDNVSMIGFSGDGGSPNSILSNGQFGISEHNDKLTIWEKNGIAANDTTAAFTFDHNGHFTAVSKSFDIEHPTEEGKRLMHGSLEGPEHGVYIRGRLEGDTIELPDYWLGLVDEDTITVQLTPNKGFQQIYVDHIEDNKVFVGTQTDTPIDCFYFIQAERKDVEKMVVEY